MKLLCGQHGSRGRSGLRKCSDDFGSCGSSLTIRSAIFAFSLALVTTIAAASSGLPPIPKGKPPRQSPRAATVQPSIPMATTFATVPTRRIKLSWDYQDLSGRSLPLPRPGVAFEVESSSDLVNWSLMVTVDAPPVFVALTQPKQFFRYKPVRISQNIL